MEGHFALATMAETVGRQEPFLEMFVAGRMANLKAGNIPKRGLSNAALNVCVRDIRVCLSVPFWDG